MMNRVLASAYISAASEDDIVILQLEHNTIRLYYQTAFEVVNAIRMASKLSMRHEGVQMPKWREVVESVRPVLPKAAPTHKAYRRSGFVSNVDKWSVAWEGSLVKLTFDALGVDMHYSDALRLHVLLRAAGHNAKAWAGDSTKQLRVSAYLNDAEENYKYNYAL